MKRIIFFAALLSLLSCSTKSQHGLDEVTLNLNGQDVIVELAQSIEERQTGLMHRTSLDKNRGMLFVFVSESRRSFWMKNTLIPLSIGYMDREGVIIDIKDMYPLDTSPVPSAGPAMYALEVNQGQFVRWGVTVGDRIDLSGLE